MELGLSQYLGGTLGLALVVASLWFGAARARAAVLPGWIGSRARVAEAVLFVTLLTLLLQLLGVVGLLGGPALCVGAVVVGAGLAWAAPRLRSVTAPPPSALDPPRESPVVVAGAAALSALAVAHWATGVGSAWAVGMQGFDTLWYHAPFAARFAAEGSILPLHFTDAAYLNWFYPQNSELHHAAGIVLFGRDLVSPWLGVAWLGLGLLSAWVVGRARGVGVVCLAAALLALDSGTLVPRSAGTAANDIGPISLLLAAAALMVSGLPRGEGRRPSEALPGAVLVLAGLAVGVAVGTKLTMLAPAAGLVVGIAWVAPRGARLRSAGLLTAGVVLPSLLWFLRNLFSAANPLPFVDAIGPIGLPGPERGLAGRDPFSVAHYLFDSSTAVETSFFADGLASAFGPAWPLVLALSAAGIALALWRGSSAARALALAALVGGIAYLFTPLTAAGVEGSPLAFEINLRYAVPALALGLVLLPLDRAFSSRSEQSGRLPVPTVVLFVVLLILLATIVLPVGDSAAGLAWERASVSSTGALVVGLVLVGLCVGIALLGRRNGRAAIAVGLVAFCAIAAFGLSASRDYLDSRYVLRINDRVGAFSMTAAARWAAPLEGERIALAGSAGAYHQYPLFGGSLENDVRYVGREASQGGFEPIRSCPEWIRALNAGRFDALVVTPSLNLNSPGAATPAPELGWVEGDPNAREVRRRGDVVVFALEGPLDAGRCPARSGQGG